MCDRTVFLNFQSQDTTPFITEVEMLIEEFHDSCIPMEQSSLLMMKPIHS